ncbi:MAG: histidinol-phosphatase [Clostridia bacterium]|nr:histidinol-phosphatase [Clostridia bacterium]
MLSNFHTHTTFCDGENTPEEIVLFAIDKGFPSIGFTGHVYTPFDLSYCMTDTDGYICEIKRLQKKYSGKIQIYLGIEEDACSIANRSDYEYIIGSSHYIYRKGKYYPIDLSTDTFSECFESFDNDILAFAEGYYSSFCDYILKRKPDIIGHFDLITKFDETLNQNKKYQEIAEKYLKKALISNCIFEINSGAISRGIRKTPYPSEDLMYVLKKNDAKIMLSSDCHNAKYLDFYFDEMKHLLKNIGFTYTYVIDNNTFKKINI